MPSVADEARERGRDARTERPSGEWMLPGGGLVLALLTAMLTGAVSYAYGVANDIRKAKLDFVNAQIERLYGPLYAASQANDEIWTLFTRTQWRNQDAADESTVFFDDTNPPTADQVRRWRHWMRTVFQPLNLRMEEALVANSHLLIGDAVPTAFRKLIAHTEAYKAVIASWRDEDLASCTAPAPQQAGGPPCLHLRQVRNTAPLNYPALVVGCVTEDYANLKRRQQELQGGFLSAFFTRGVAPSPACG